METIEFRIRNEEELYHPFDPTLINDEIVSFLEERVRKPTAHLTIRIICDESVDEERLRKAIARFIELRRNSLRTARRMNLAQQIRLLIIGIFFILLWLFVSARTEGVGPEILSILGSFAIWEAADIWLLENPEILMKRLILKKLEHVTLSIDTPRAGSSPGEQGSREG